MTVYALARPGAGPAAGPQQQGPILGAGAGGARIGESRARRLDAGLKERGFALRIAPYLPCVDSDARKGEQFDACH